MFHEINDLPAGAIGFRATGRISRADRDSQLERQIESARSDGQSVRLLYVDDHDFAGYDPNALLDDVVFGTRHFRDFAKIAFVAEDGPYRRAAVALEGLIPAALKVLPAEDIESAKAWLAE